MSDSSDNRLINQVSQGALGRRDFVAASVAASLAATASSASAAGMEVVETSVEIKTPDGTCDASFIHPKSGSYPGVLIWADAFGPMTREWLPE